MAFFNLRDKSSNSYSSSSHSHLYNKKEFHESSLSERRSYIESKRVTEEVEEGESWMLTYSDMVTLLLTFFILLYSMSDINQQKFEELKSAISGEILKKEVEKPFEEITKELKSIVEQRHLENAVFIDSDPLGVQIELASSSLYESGSAAIKLDMSPVVQQLGAAINTLDLSQFLIEVEGHTDDIPIKSPKYESNWELSSHRATNVVKLLIESGIPIEKLKASGFADSRPVALNRDINGVSIPENQEKNRRVMIYVRRNTEFIDHKVSK
ncbi:chemotaxis protein MotB [bacterium]|nr:MAG: chemotaxis protein MotB [bacterium]